MTSVDHGFPSDSGAAVSLVLPVCSSCFGFYSKKKIGPGFTRVCRLHIQGILPKPQPHSYLVTMHLQFVTHSKKDSPIYIPCWECLPGIFHCLWENLPKKQQSGSSRWDWWPLSFFSEKLQIRTTVNSITIHILSPKVSMLSLGSFFCLFTDGRVGAGPVLYGDPVFGKFLWKHLHAGSSFATHAGLSCLVPLDHRSHCGYVADATCGVYTSLVLTQPTTVCVPDSLK